MGKLYQEMEGKPNLFLVSQAQEIELRYLIAAAPLVRSSLPEQVIEFLAAPPRNSREIINEDVAGLYRKFSEAVKKGNPKLLPKYTPEDGKNLLASIGYAEVGLLPYLRKRLISEDRTAFTVQDIQDYLVLAEKNAPASLPLVKKMCQELLDRANGLQANAAAGIVRMPDLDDAPLRYAHPPGKMPKPSKAHADRYPIFDQKLFPSQSNSGPITRRFAVCLGAASLATVLFCGVSTKRLRLFPAVPETSMRPIFTDGYHERWMKSLEPEIRVEQKSINDFDALLKGNYIKALHQYYEKTKEPIYMDTDISMDGNRVSYDLQRLTLYQHDLKQNSKVALKIETDEKGLYGKGTLECFFMHNHRTGETSPIEFFFYKEGVHQYPPELPENGYRISEQKFEAELSRMLNEMRTATQNGNFVGASMPNKSNSNLRDMLDEMQKNVSYAKTGQGRSFGLNYIEGWKP